MTQWLFTKDFPNKREIESIINLKFITHIMLREEDNDIVLFTLNRESPHSLLFRTKEECLKAYETICQMVKDMEK